MDSTNARNGVRRPALALALAVLAVLVAPGSAGAAYAPRLSVAVDPPTAGARIALTTTVTQALGEEASRSVRVRFPVGFVFNLAALQGVTACTAEQYEAGACPESSRLGRASAQTPLGTFSGGVFMGAFPRFYAFLSNGVGLFDQRLEGVAVVREDGGLDVSFDDLPSFPTTRFQMALDGPPRSVLNAPSTCGDFEFVGEFASQGGDRVRSASTVAVTGCAGPGFRLASMRVSPRRVRRPRTVAVAFALSAPAAVEVTVRRAGRRRVLQRRRLSAGAGGNTVRRLGRRLAPGLYVVTVRARTADGRVANRSRTFQVLPARAARLRG
jgi:hypothetical protein